MEGLRSPSRKLEDALLSWSGKTIYEEDLQVSRVFEMFGV